MRRLSRLLLILLALIPAHSPLLAETWHAGGFSFSDELGGLGIRSVSGSGRVDDPIVIVEEILDQQAVTLVVRAVAPRDPNVAKDGYLNLAIRVVAINRTERVWAGFNLELREVREKPSTYFDGLSFWQMMPLSDHFRSDRFAVVKRRAEPADIVQYRGGSVDPGGQLHLWFQISDTSPVQTFYLIQEPVFLMARHGTGGPSFAEAVGPGEAGGRQATGLGTLALPRRERGLGPGPASPGGPG